MDEAEYCDRLAMIYRGELVAIGTPDELKNKHIAAQSINLECMDSKLIRPSLEDVFVSIIEAQDKKVM